MTERVFDPWDYEYMGEAVDAIGRGAEIANLKLDALEMKDDGYTPGEVEEIRAQHGFSFGQIAEGQHLAGGGN